MSGWVPQDASWWPVIAEALPKPWPREAVLNDLRWWQDQERLGSRARPGRIELARRWGWTDWSIKQAFKAESEWGSPIHAPVADTIPPAHRQPTASAPPADRQPTNGTTVVSEDVPPADRQRAASAPPADRPAREKTQSEEQRTETRVTEFEQTHTARADEPPSSKPFSVETPTALSPNKNKNTAGAKNLIAAAYMLENETYPDRYRDVPFGRPPSLRTPKCEKAIARAARDGVTPEDLETLWAYMHKSDERDPAWYRSDPTLMFWGSIYNDNGMTRMSAARDWAARGRVDLLVPRDSRGPPRNGHSKTTEGDMLLRMFQDYRDRPDGGPHGE